MTLSTYEEVIDAEIVPDELTPEQARKLTDKIRVNLDGIWELVTEAYTAGAHRALGYASWDAYCTTEFGSNRIQLPKEERAETVRSLRESGLSPNAIASATGTSRRTVNRELDKSGWANAHPGETLGQDGKTYTRPEPTVSERDWPDVPEPEDNENRETDMANGLRNDLTALTNQYVGVLNSIAKNLPKENLSPGANAHVAQAMRNCLAEIEKATNRAAAHIEGERK